MKERFNVLIDQLLSAKDLKTAQAIALELRWVTYEYLDQFREDVLPDDPHEPATHS